MGSRSKRLLVIVVVVSAGGLVMAAGQSQDPRPGPKGTWQLKQAPAGEESTSDGSLNLDDLDRLRDENGYGVDSREYEDK
jgi:hypothetical protein